MTPCLPRWQDPAHRISRRACALECQYALFHSMMKNKTTSESNFVLLYWLKGHQPEGPLSRPNSKQSLTVGPPFTLLKCYFPISDLEVTIPMDTCVFLLLLWFQHRPFYTYLSLILKLMWVNWTCSNTNTLEAGATNLGSNLCILLPNWLSTKSIKYLKLSLFPINEKVKILGKL